MRIDETLVRPIALAFWPSQPDSLRRLVPDHDGCRVLSLALPVPGCARRGSRLGSELPPSLPCWLVKCVSSVRVGDAVILSPKKAGIAPAQVLSCQSRESDCL